VDDITSNGGACSLVLNKDLLKTSGTFEDGPSQGFPSISFSSTYTFSLVTSLLL
jgi:hypothetical protein